MRRQDESPPPAKPSAAFGPVFDPFTRETVLVGARLVDRLMGPTPPSGEPDHGWYTEATTAIKAEAADRVEALERTIEHLVSPPVDLVETVARRSYERLGGTDWATKGADERARHYDFARIILEEARKAAGEAS